MDENDLPWALKHLPEIERIVRGRKRAFFLDLDGTLAPLAPTPDLARVPARTRSILSDVAQRHLMCVVSGRGLADLRRKVGIDAVYYAADHGHRIVGPQVSGIDIEIEGAEAGTMLAAATELDRRLKHITGVLIEVKEVTLSVHYRLVAEGERASVRRTVAEVAQAFPALRLTEGKLVCELRPPGTWNKGRAMLWLLERLGFGRKDICPICIGDDLTDEDMFKAAGGWGVCIVVGDPGRPTDAGFRVRDSHETATLLEKLGAL